MKRVKTEQELIKEFGQFWFNKTDWNISYNRVLGCPYPNIGTVINISELFLTEMSESYEIEYKKNVAEEKEIIRNFTFYEETYNIVEVYTRRGDSVCSIIKNVTGNCQLSSLQYFDHCEYLGVEKMNILLKHLSDAYVHKYQYLVDVGYYHLHYLKQFNLITEPAKYISTNGSTMYLSIIKV